MLIYQILCLIKVIYCVAMLIYQILCLIKVVYCVAMLIYQILCLIKVIYCVVKSAGLYLESRITVFTIFCLTADVNDAGQCSITRKGIYTYRDKASECTGTVNIGCTTPNKIIIDTKCKDQFSNAYKEKGKLSNIDLKIICGLSLLYPKTQG